MSNSTAMPAQRHVFLPFGSIWLGILALLFQVVAVSSGLFGWGNVMIQDTLSRRSTELLRFPRFQLTITTVVENGDSQSIRGTDETILLSAVPIAGLGLVLALLSLVVYGQHRRYAIVGFCLNVSYFVLDEPVLWITRHCG